MSKEQRGGGIGHGIRQHEKHRYMELAGNTDLVRFMNDSLCGHTVGVQDSVERQIETHRS